MVGAPDQLQWTSRFTVMATFNKSIIPYDYVIKFMSPWFCVLVYLETNRQVFFICLVILSCKFFSMSATETVDDVLEEMNAHSPSLVPSPSPSPCRSPPARGRERDAPWRRAERGGRYVCTFMQNYVYYLHRWLRGPARE